MVTILQFTALGDSNEVLLTHTDINGQKNFLSIDKVSPLLEPLNPQHFRYKKLLYGGVNSRVTIDIQPNIIFNSVGDPDRCSRALAKVQEAAVKNPFPYINHPSSINNIRADRLYSLLKGIDGLSVPKCVRTSPTSLVEIKETITKNNFTLPVIIEEAGTNPEDKNSFLFEKAEDIHLLERFAFDGRAYYVREFFNYRSNDSLYRKYRFFMIGNKVMPAHLIISTQWHIRNDEQAHKGFKENLPVIEKEETHFLRAYQKKRIPALLTLKERLGLDFFAVDCSIDIHGHLTLFDIDCEAHYFERVKNENYYTTKQIRRYNEAVETMIFDKLKKGGKHNHV